MLNNNVLIVFKAYSHTVTTDDARNYPQFDAESEPYHFASESETSQRSRYNYPPR